MTTLVDQALAMYSKGEYTKLRAFKKTKKKSWMLLGINAEMEARVMEEPTLSPAQTQAIKTAKLKFDRANLKVIKYVPREIHAIKGESSFATMAQMSAIREQEKFRADPRFPIFQMRQRYARLQEIFKGPAGKPLFE